MSDTYTYTNSKGQTYYLHMKDVILKNDRKQRIYFFARDVREGSISDLPQGFEVFETLRTGMPVLRKIK